MPGQSRFLEASIVRQEDSKLKNPKRDLKAHRSSGFEDQFWHLKSKELSFLHSFFDLLYFLQIDVMTVTHLAHMKCECNLNHKKGIGVQGIHLKGLRKQKKWNYHLNLGSPLDNQWLLTILLWGVAYSKIGVLYTDDIWVLSKASGRELSRVSVQL